MDDKLHAKPSRLKNVKETRPLSVFHWLWMQPLAELALLISSHYEYLQLELRSLSWKNWWLIEATFDALLSKKAI